MTHTLQALRYPHLVLDEILRIGSKGIVTFPNFGNWRTRTYLSLRGRMPVTKQLAYQWYDTPNIHFLPMLILRPCVKKEILIFYIANFWPMASLTPYLNRYGQTYLPKPRFII